MLRINVLGNWCSVERSSGHVGQSLRNLSEEVSFIEYESGGGAVSWTELSNLTFGGTEWYSIEGSLLLEARRAVLYRELPDNSYRTHLILIALLPTSLIHLRNRMSSLLKEHLETEMNPVKIQLDKIARRLLDKETISGYAALNGIGSRHLVFGRETERRLHGLLGHISENRIDAPHTFSLSELYLEVGEPKTEVILSGEGTLTFTDPEVTLSRIDNVFSFLAQAYQDCSLYEDDSALGARSSKELEGA